MSWKAVFAVFALAALPGMAWNAPGHRVIAAIAYDHLTPEARAKVDELIRNHPDYQHFAAGGGGARGAFLSAANWADEIRGDDRFYDESRPDAVATPKLPGYPDMGRHGFWHYYDMPFSTDGTVLKDQPEPHAWSELKRLTAHINSSYDLVWLIHIAGDIHQPLHCTDRFMASLPNGDQGGNLEFVPPGRTLHSLWDSSLTTNVDEVDALAAELPSLVKQPLSMNVNDWIREGYDLARSDVYTFGDQIGTREMPMTLPAGYEENAHRIARVQVGRAGIRLAAVLNSLLSVTPGPAVPN